MPVLNKALLMLPYGKRNDLDLCQETKFKDGGKNDAHLLNPVVKYLGSAIIDPVFPWPHDVRLQFVAADGSMILAQYHWL